MPLAQYTTLRLGGPAARFTAALTQDQAVAVVREADSAGEPVLVLGGGSNLVVGDTGFPGIVVHLQTSGVSVGPPVGHSSDRRSSGGEPVMVTAEAGEDWDALVARCVDEGLAGIECLSGIPGLAGATPIQNVGAYGQEVAETVVAVRAYDRVLDAVVELPAAECAFGYRTSVFKRQPATGRTSGQRGASSRRAGLDPAAATGRWVVLEVTFCLMRDSLSAPVRYAELARALDVSPGDQVPLADARSAVLALRRRKGMVVDPADPDTRSAGSFFTNPVLEPGQFEQLQRRVAGQPGAPGQDAGVPNFPAEDGRVKIPAAWLIEHAGFTKGYRGDGGVQISSKHTLALVSADGASTAALLRLARQITDGVRQAFGVDLVPEPVLVGAAL